MFRRETGHSHFLSPISPLPDFRNFLRVVLWQDESKSEVCALLSPIFRLTSIRHRSLPQLRRSTDASQKTRRLTGRKMYPALRTTNLHTGQILPWSMQRKKTLSEESEIFLPQMRSIKTNNVIGLTIENWTVFSHIMLKKHSLNHDHDIFLIEKMDMNRIIYYLCPIKLKN